MRKRIPVMICILAELLQGNKNICGYLLEYCRKSCYNVRKNRAGGSAHMLPGRSAWMKGGADMDIAGVSMALSTASVQSQVGTAVLGKAMDTNEALGAGMVRMIDAAAMEQSVNPSVGANLDIRI